MNSKKVNLINLRNDEEIPAKLEYTTAIPTKIILFFEDKTIEAEANDLLDTLNLIRKQLNEINLDILVNGSRKNISSSPMLRGASAGEKTYLTRLRIQARIEDIVSIFESIRKENYSSIEEQSNFDKLWTESLHPTEGEKQEAKNYPNGWVYRIDSGIDPNGQVEPEEIIGAWKVDNKGNLTNEWELNKNFIPKEIRDKNT